MRKDARTRGEDARPKDGARLDEIRVGEHVVGRALRVPCGSDAIRKIGKILPHLRLVNSAGRPHVSMHIDKAGHDRRPRHIHNLCPRRYGDLSLRSERRDSVVGNNDIAPLEDLAPLHRDDARAAEDDRPLRPGARSLDSDLDGFGFVGGRLLPVESSSPRPGHPFTVRRPAQVIPAFGGQLFDRDGRRSARSDADIHRLLAGFRNRHQIVLVLEVDKGASAFG